jgi:hypothetical protein
VFTTNSFASVVLVLSRLSAKLLWRKLTGDSSRFELVYGVNVKLCTKDVLCSLFYTVSFAPYTTNAIII